MNSAMNNKREKDLLVLFNETHKVNSRDINKQVKERDNSFNTKMFGTNGKISSKPMSEREKMFERQKNMNAAFKNINNGRFN